MNGPVHGLSTTCDRCGCQPIVTDTARNCPAGGVCLGTSESNDAGTVRKAVDNPNAGVTGSLAAGIPPKTGARVVPKMGKA